MDSFYDTPRCAPNPTVIEKLQYTPVVPEVSLLSSTDGNSKEHNAYKHWRTGHYNQVLNVNTENINNGQQNIHNSNLSNNQDSSQLLRKQVRFESPTIQQRPSLTYKQFNKQNNAETDHKIWNQNVAKCSLKPKEPHCGKTFEEIYMANIPNRHLDLSIIEFSNRSTNGEKHSLKPQPVSCVSDEVKKVLENKENELPKTYREFLETQKKVIKAKEDIHNDSVTDIFNYKRYKTPNTVNPEKQNSFQHQIDNYNTKKTFEPLRNAQENIVHNKYDIEQKFDDTLKNKGLKYNYNPHVNTQKDMVVDKYNFEQKFDNPLKNEEFKYDSGHHITEPYKFTDWQCRNNTNSSKCETWTQSTDICCQHKVKDKDDFEPTNRDLLKIITQQNEQLLLLQKQVAMLLSREQSSTKPIEPAPQKLNEIEGSFLKNSCFRNPVQDTPRKKGLSKFSVDVMTSFEVAIRPQHNRQNLINCKPKIQEITEVESITSADRNEKTQSLLLQEPLVIPETCPSPEPSININMQDYDSSDDEVSASEIGATFYNNLMGQVNNILRKAHVKTTEDLAFRDKDKEKEAEVNIKTNKTMLRVKEATLKHLKNIGVTIKDLENDDFNSLEDQSQEYSPTEISFAVKQLLMKYLPNDHLAKISPKQHIPTETDKICPPLTNVRPELSFASLQYMKKYNLIPSTETKPKLGRCQEQPINKCLNQIDNPKILDITALKMQPKLL